jgi:cytochrome bd-type quinol oxidase subunit 2
MPNFTRFLITGAVLGLIVGALIGGFGTHAPNYDSGTEVAYLAAFGLFIGLGLAGLVAIGLDAWLRRRSGD